MAKEKYFLNRKNFDVLFEDYKSWFSENKYFEVAEYLNLSRVQFSQILTGSRPIKMEILKKLAEHYGCDWSYLACIMNADGELIPLVDLLRTRSSVHEIAQNPGGLSYLITCIKDIASEDAVFSHLCDALIACIDEKEQMTHEVNDVQIEPEKEGHKCSLEH